MSSRRLPIILIPPPQALIASYASITSPHSIRLARRVQERIAEIGYKARASAPQSLKDQVKNAIASNRKAYLRYFSWSPLSEYCAAEDLKSSRFEECQRIQVDLPIRLLEPRCLTSEDLQNLHELVCPATDHSFRKIPIYTTRDTNGLAHQYVSPSEVEEGINRTLARINDSSPVEPVLSATWAMTSILNCHPFIDGNGRVARAMFALELIRRGENEAPRFPLDILCTAVPKFFKCCANSLILYGKPEMLLQFLLSAGDFVAECIFENNDPANN